MNEISSIHTPNYADLNILLPETVKSIEIVRGPFAVECGDSNIGGCVNITTKRSEPFASLGVSGGSQGTARGVGTYSTQRGAYLAVLVLEGYRTDGYRDNSFVNRYNSFNKVTMPLRRRRGGFVARAGLWHRFRRARATSAATQSRPGRFRRTLGHQSRPMAATSSYENFVTNYSSGATDQELRGTLFASHEFQPLCRFRWRPALAAGRAQFFGGACQQGLDRRYRRQMPVQVLVGSNWRTDLIEAYPGSDDGARGRRCAGGQRRHHSDERRQVRTGPDQAAVVAEIHRQAGASINFTTTSMTASRWAERQTSRTAFRARRLVSPLRP